MAKLRIGRKVNPADASLSDEEVLLDGDDLVTHGVVFGMTGSGKTGLCVGLMEELILAGIPLLIIDPKGDLANLALQFPELSAREFQPWIDPEAARREGQQPEQYAAATANRWREGLGKWGLGPAQVQELASRMRLTIYTPGSPAGVPVNVLGSFRAPAQEILEDAEARSDLVTGTVSGLLSLISVSADPIRSPEHIVVSTILDQAWEQGEDLPLETLVARLVDPPFKKVGVFPVDTFFPPTDRMKLAMALNGVLASPTFASWMQGEDLDLARMCDTSSGTPVNIFYLAHLSDTERMFFVSLLLDRVVAWTRTLPGATGLRALVYFDEVAGYLPPHPREPASKRPILTLLKQARAVGVGTLLATQNPVDIDYKALSNAGTWMIGRLQTQQDRDRVMDGLISASGGLDRQQLKERFEGLRPRVFLLKQAREDKPLVFHTRWCMTYLRGPLTRTELERLTPPTPPSARSSEPATQDADKPLDTNPGPTPSGFETAFLDPNAVFSARMEDFFASLAEARREDGRCKFRPALFAEIQLRFDEKKSGFLLDERQHRLFFPISEGLPSSSLETRLEGADLLSEAPGPGVYEPLPESLDEQRELTAARDTMLDEVYRTVTRGQWINPALKLYGRAGESRDDFEARCREAIQDRVDQKVAKGKDRYDKAVDKIEKKIARKREQLDKLETTVSGRQTEQLVHAGEMILGFFTGRKRSITSAFTRHRTTSESRKRLEVTEGQLGELQEELTELMLELENELEEIEEKELEALEDIREEQVRLTRKDVKLARFGVLWIPVTRRI